MDILNFISWIKGKRLVTTVDPAKTLIPIGLKDGRRDDEYLAGAITVEDFAASIVAPPAPPAYKVYTALLTQSETDAPVATVLENTLGGDITWEYDGVGAYSIYNLDLPINKTILLTPSIPANSCTVGSAITNLVSMSLHPSGTFINLCVGNSIDGVNGELNRHPIEIRVYN